jgi:hypothetical protein
MYDRYNFTSFLNSFIKEMIKNKEKLPTHTKKNRIVYRITNCDAQKEDRKTHGSKNIPWMLSFAISRKNHSSNLFIYLLHKYVLSFDPKNGSKNTHRYEK